MRISRLGALVVGLAGLSLPCDALSAAVIEPLSIENLSLESDRIVLGTVLDVRSRWNEDRTLIYSTVYVAPSAVLKGERRAVESIDQIGGTIDGITLRRTDTPMFEPGDGVVLFINNDDKLVGSYQGAYFTDGRLVGNCEPAEHSVSRSGVMPLRMLADDVAFALNQRPVDDAQLQMPGIALPNAGRYALAGYSWAYLPHPMGEEFCINGNARDPAMGPHHGWNVVGVFLGSAGWWDNIYANFKFYLCYAPTYSTTIALDDENLAFFCQVGSCGMDPATVATTYIWSEGPNIIEWDIVFNDNYHRFWNSVLCRVGPCECPAGHYDIISIAAHEFGHAAGLAHSDVPGATMRANIQICERDAQYPDQDDINGIIELYGSVQGTPFEFIGQESGDTLGSSGGNAGDIDGDGVNDLITGAPYNDDVGTDVGRAYIYSGRTGRLMYIRDGAARYDRFGWSVAAGGDVDGDGRGDFIVGAPFASRLRGRVYVYSGATGDIIHELAGRDRHNDRFGWSVAGNLDVNNDGYADIIVGSPYGDNAYETNSGKVEVFSGRTGLRLAEFFGEKRYDLFGWSVAGVGRINSDENDDFLVGAPFNDSAGSNAGKAYIYSGRHLSLIYSIKGYQSGSRFGYRLAGLGRVDLEDGRGDFVVASPYYDRDGANESGRIDVFSGRYGQRIYSKKGEQTSDRLGWSVAAAGDYDGDGGDDIIIGSPKHSSIDFKRGRAYVRSGLTGATLMHLDGENEGDQFGYTVGGLGDVDDDGIPDVIVGAPYNDDRSDGAGRTYLYRSTEVRSNRFASAETEGTPAETTPNSDLASQQSHERSRIRQLLNAWMDGGLLADLNDDGVVNDDDLSLIISGKQTK